jgi:hypothetical protein
MVRPESSIQDNPDALPIVRGFLARHRECRWDAYDLAQALQLSDVEVQYALEALRDDEGELLP